MIVLLKHKKVRDNRLTVVLGTGLLGSTLISTLEKVPNTSSQKFLNTWTNPQRLNAEVALLLSALLRESPSVVNWVWSAGATGFGSNQSEVDQELQVFELFIQSIEARASQDTHINHKFHFISSAGGLFEGQRMVDGNTIPNPKRPYGMLKLKQEEMLKESRLPTVIYRPSTVYGYMRPGKRIGFITTLLQHALTGVNVPITGRLDTLRDYIWVEDVVSFVADIINNPDSSAGVCHFLVSGNAHSIVEIIEMAERITGNTIHHEAANIKSNSEHITFNSILVPSGLKPTTLEMGMRTLFADIKKQMGA